MASEHERRYNDREFALILNRAAELSASIDSSTPRPTGLSLEEIKAIALEAGFDSGLIERAARQLPTSSGGSAVERVIGGPVRHEITTRFTARLTDEQSAHLLAIVRAVAAQQGEGDSRAGAMSWNSVGEFSQLFVSAHGEEAGTRARVVVNRQEALVVTTMLSLTAGTIVPFLIAAGLGFESLAVNAAIFAAGFGGSVATARAFWSATTKRWRTRASALMDTLAQTLDQSSKSAAIDVTRISDHAETPARDETKPTT